MTYYISGHLDLSWDEFEEHYKPTIEEVMRNDPDPKFVVGDARGCDHCAQVVLHFQHLADVTVYHMFEKPRNAFVATFPLVGGFKTDEERDAAMTAASDADIAWVRPGREKSGTARNIERRTKQPGA